MVENLNGTGEFATKKGKATWERAEKEVGSQLVDQVKAGANPFYAYSTFCRERKDWALSHGVTNPVDIEVVRLLSLRDISNTAFHQQSLNQTTQLEGIKIIKVEARRIAEILGLQEYPAETAALD